MPGSPSFAAILACLLTFHAGAAAEPPATIIDGYILPQGTVPGESISRPSQLRRKPRYHVLVDGTGPVRLSLAVSSATVQTTTGWLTVCGSDGNVRHRQKVTTGANVEVEIDPQDLRGLLTVDCHVRNGVMALKVDGGRVLLPIHEPIHVFRHANPLYFHVKRGADSFEVQLAGESPDETVSATVCNPDGEAVTTLSTASHLSARADVKIPAGMDGRIWSIRFDKAERGVLEDFSVILTGDVGPFAAERATDVAYPAVELETPPLARSGETILARIRPAPEATGVVDRLAVQVVADADRTVIARREVGHEPLSWDLTPLLEPGEYRIVVEGERQGRRWEREQSLIVVRPPPTIDNNRSAWVGDKPFFARGLYHVKTEDYAKVKQQGFNLVQATPQQIEHCEKAGLKAAVTLYSATPLDPEGYAKTVRMYKHSPAVACWMLKDEPDLHATPWKLLAQAYASVRRESPQPAYLCLCTPSGIAEFGACTDLFAPDVYPVGHGPLTMIADRLDLTRQVAGERPIWFIGQVWPYKDRPNVTPRQHRCMTFLALTHGDVHGLLWYSLNDPGWYLPESHPALWDMCGVVNRQLEELEPVLLTRVLWEHVQKSGEGEIHLAARQHADKLFIIAVNPTDAASRLTLDLAKLGADPTGLAREIFEQRDPELNDGILRDHFAPLDVRVYAVSMTRR
ncbi:MAG TPA: hypothetical protein PL151_03395 [Phycisphaerae bacterium]|nr:hypothetical protein [Phycisphaerae bacterium]